ncbi:NAD(P)-binding protein [Alternaria alternata]|nr:NAD(P)-binding protein [Alternaria alternata]
MSVATVSTSPLDIASARFSTRLRPTKRAQSRDHPTKLEVARAWAIAGAEGIVLTGRNQEGLKEPAEAIASLSPSTRVLCLSADLINETDVEAMFTKAVSQFGTVDVVLHAAGSIGGGPVGDLPPNAWFSDYEVNVKGSYVLAHYYLKAVAAGTLIFVGTLGASFTFAGMSSYSGSKMALLKLAEYLDAGIVAATKTQRGMIVDSLTPFALDKGIQTGGLSLYLAQSKADYLKGSFVSVNWDLDELEKHKSEITEQKLLKLAFLGAKLGTEGHPWSN